MKNGALIDVKGAVASLEATAAAIHALAEGLSPEAARWRAAPGKWSILEIVNHLADEEAEDFRARLDVILHRPGDKFAPIDPPRWVVERGYAEKDLQESLARYREERERSLAWLRGLGDPDLDAPRRSGGPGPVTGRELLAGWMAHDLLHVRQITRVRYDRVAALAAPDTLAYAGEWV